MVAFTQLQSQEPRNNPQQRKNLVPERLSSLLTTLTYPLSFIPRRPYVRRLTNQASYKVPIYALNDNNLSVLTSSTFTHALPRILQDHCPTFSRRLSLLAAQQPNIGESKKSFQQYIPVLSMRLLANENVLSADLSVSAREARGRIDPVSLDDLLPP